LTIDPTPSVIGPFLYLLFLAAALGLFVRIMWKRFMILKKSQPDPRFNRWLDRAKHMFLYAIGQKRIIAGDLIPGLIHAFIFWGFLAVALNSFHHVGKGFIAGFHLPFLGPNNVLGAMYIVFRDIFELIVLIMVVAAIYRRAVIKPARLTLSGEAQLILGFIGILMITDFFMSGAEAVADPPGFAWSPIQNLFAGIMSGASEGTLKAVYISNWWIHTVVLFAFLNLLPLGKHFHVITSLPNVFFSKLDDEGPIGTLNKLDLEDEEAESFGYDKIEDFTWKENLDLYSCTECGRCQELCPAFLSEKPLSPKELIVAYRDHLYAKQDRILGKEGDKEWEGPQLTSEDVVSEDTLWACTTCHWCEEACPLFIGHIDKLTEQRRNLVLMESQFPSELMPVFKGLENNSNPWNIGAASRGDWAEGLDVPFWEDNPDAEYLYYVGCAGSFDDRNKKVSRALVQLLQRAGVSFAVLGTDEPCCGDQARRLGNEYLFQMMAETVIETFKELGVKKIVTTCPHGYNVMKNEYPQMDGTFTVIHHTELLRDLIQQGKLQPEKSLAQKVCYHDSCYLGRYNEIYQEPRHILGHIPGLQLVESELHHQRALCCGAGGGRMWMEENLGTRINQLRLEQMAATDAKLMSVACPFCMTMISDGIKETGREEELSVKDVAELLLEALPEERESDPSLQSGEEKT